MAGRTEWTAGNGVGLTFTSAFNAADLDSLANGSSVMSSVADIANNTALDIYADVAVELIIASTTLAAGALISLFLFDKFEIDGSNSYYGDNSMASGSQKAYTPTYGMVGSLAPTITGAAQTKIVGVFRGILLPPRAFRFAFLNQSGVTLASSGHFSQYVTYNLQLNN